jgi:hypothetical protein
VKASKRERERERDRERETESEVPGRDSKQSPSHGGPHVVLRATASSQYLGQFNSISYT